QRLSRQGKFAWSIPEIVTIFIAAVSFVLFREDEYFDINTFSEMILASAVISLPIGIPLVLTKVRFFWFDIAYIVAGLLMIRFGETLPDGPNIGAGALVVLCFLFFFIGGSFSRPRGLDFSSFIIGA